MKSALEKKIELLDWIGLIAIGVFSLGYLYFQASFAELNIQLPFLDFPIFVGEVLLFICLVLYLIKWRLTQPKLNIWHKLIIAYVVFVVVKALYGYIAQGPLAFRNAALFYYPLFAVFSYSFFRKDYFDTKRVLFFFIVIIWMLIEQRFSAYWALSCFILGLICIKIYPNKILKYIMLIVLLVLTPYKLFFHTARTMFVGNLATCAYLALALSYIAPVNRKAKFLLVFLGIFIIGTGVVKLSDTTRAKSIIGVREIMKQFDELDDVIRAQIPHYEFKKYSKVQIFRPEEGENELISRLGIARGSGDQTAGYQPNPLYAEETVKDGENMVHQETASPANYSVIPREEASQKESRKKSAEIKFSEKRIGPQFFPEESASTGSLLPPAYDIIGGYNNAIFRIFIWRDMLVELAKEKPILGFSFGKPFQSRSLEILNWGTADLDRDGWIAAHNSYLHILYRSGVIGIAFIVIVFGILFQMIKIFIRSKAVVGILLCGIIIDWFVATNFLLILELPYTAIPVWSLYGMTLAYCYKNETSEYALEKQKSPGHRG